MRDTEKKPAVIYIAGKMTGLPDYGRAQFNAMEAELVKLGYIVLNPACLPLGMETERYMPITLAMLSQADKVCFLNGWETSQGAILERKYAEYQQKEILTEDDFRKLSKETA